MVVEPSRVEHRVVPVKHPWLSLRLVGPAEGRGDKRAERGGDGMRGGCGGEEDVGVGRVQAEEVDEVSRQVKRVAEVEVAVLTS